MPKRRKRPVVTAAQIDGSQKTITVEPDAIITPSAYDRAASLGVSLFKQSQPSAPGSLSTTSTEFTSPNIEHLVRRIEHTNLSPTATRQHISRLCDEARTLGCAAVCVNPIHVPLAVELCTATQTRVCTVIGFPTGAHHTKVKMEEASRVVGDGAHEVDMVANHALLLQDELSAYAADIRCVRQAIGDRVTLKVIIEASQLCEEDIVRAALAAEQSGANYVKTSTGVYGQARIEDVQLLRHVLQPATQIKAAGGINDAAFALQLIDAGADRLGMSKTLDVIGGIRSQRRT